LSDGPEKVIHIEAGIVFDKWLERLQSSARSVAWHPEALHADYVRLVLTGYLRGELIPVVREGDGLQLDRDVRVLLVYVLGEIFPDLGLLRSVRPHRPAQRPRGAAPSTGPMPSKPTPASPAPLIRKKSLRFIALSARTADRGSARPPATRRPATIPILPSLLQLSSPPRNRHYPNGLRDSRNT